MKLLKIIDNISKFFEIKHRQNIFDFIKKKKIISVIDVGAHKGDFSDGLIENKKLQKIFLFEPQSTFFLYLVNKYKKIKKIKIYNFAIDICNEIKKIKLNIDPSTSSLSIINKKSLLYKIKNIILDSKDIYYSSESVSTLRLDYFLIKNKIKKISLLKIDTEGYEMKVLKSLGSKIKIIKYILVELKFIHFYKNYSQKKIHEFLLKNNFALIKNFRHPMQLYKDSLYINKKIL